MISFGIFLIYRIEKKTDRHIKEIRPVYLSMNTEEYASSDFMIFLEILLALTTSPPMVEGRNRLKNLPM